MKAVEFFSGIGGILAAFPPILAPKFSNHFLDVCGAAIPFAGLHYALLEACPDASVLAAYDINDIANAVYTHNFKHSPVSVDICSLTAKQLDALAADIWLLSPPCQPYTRRGAQRQSSDSRSAGFLELLVKLKVMLHPPNYLLLENVVGFESSDTRALLCTVLTQVGFTYQEFLVSPCQLGIPYSRPRYFGLGKRRGHFALQLSPNGQPFTQPPSLLLAAGPSGVAQPISEPTSVGSFLDRCMLERGHHHFCNLEDLLLSDEILRKHGWCLDMVGPDSTRINCITKAYSHFIKGSGSVLATENVELIATILERFPAPSEMGAPGSEDTAKESSNTDKTNQTEELVCMLKQLRLRFLSPGEVAALHSFPTPLRFSFPEHVTLRQKYQLLGNSLSVAVVADLLKYLFMEP